MMQFGAARGDRHLRSGNATAKALAMACMFLGQPLLAQENEPELETRLDALEQELREQRSDFEAQRELLERTIHEQQKNLEAQQRQLSAQYELIRELQTERGGAPPAEAVEPRTELAGTPTGQLPEDSAAADEASEGQRAAEAELAKRTAAGEEMREVDAKATLYDPSNTVFDPDFPGAWHLPGTTAAMKIGGFVNLSLVNSFDPVEITDRFIVGSIPPEGEEVAGARSGMDVTARQTRLNFEVREQTSHGTLRAFVEGDFEGAGEGGGEFFRLRHAFGQYNNLLAGKTWTTFMNVNALPEEVDFEGVNGVVLRRQPQLRFFPDFGKDASFVFSIEEPGTDVVNGTGTKGAWDLVVSMDRLPLGELGSWNYRLSGVLRDLEGQYDTGSGSDPEDDTLQNGRATGWGVTTSGRFNITGWGPNDFLLWQLTYGEGIGRYVNDLSTIGGGDAVFGPDGKLYALPLLAGFLSYQHAWASKGWFMKDWPGIMRSNFTLSWIDVDNYKFQDGKDYRQTWRASANLLYFPTQNLRLGGELLWGLRKNKDGSEGTAMQLQLSARYNF
jgi:hypothetical protein